MKLPEFGVNRPAATAMLFLAVLTLGIICFLKIGLDLTPEIEPTRVTVVTTWQGASCEDVETKVTRILEKSLGSVSNLDEIRSSTSEGRSTIACTFTWGTNIDEASNDIRARVDRAKRSLPDDIDDPLILKFDSASMPVMLIGVTAKDLEAEVKKGSFREDLFYRVHVIPVRIPPLRERREDIVPLAEHFLKKTSEKMKKEVKGLTPMAIQKLMLHDWPGNVRELENAIEYAVVTSRGEVISDEAILPFRETLSTSPKPFKEAKEDFEKEYLNWVLQIAEGNVSKAAGMAGKYRADFYSLLKKYDLKPEDFKKT